VNSFPNEEAFKNNFINNIILTLKRKKEGGFNSRSVKVFVIALRSGKLFNDNLTLFIFLGIMLQA